MDNEKSSEDQASMSAVTDLDKRLDESTVTATKQMTLFHLTDVIDKNHSNLIDIYDALDKYSYSRDRQVAEIKNASRESIAIIKKAKIHTVVRAANMTDSNGNTYLVYPGEREERVEEALRKLAVNGDGVFIDGSAGVTFTLYGLQKELKANGYHYKIPEIKDAILVNRRAALTITTGDGSCLVDSGFFEAVWLVDRAEYERNSKSKCYVRFNPLVTESILQLSYRRYNYTRSMEIRPSLARYMYKRMSLYYVQASPRDPYTPNLISFLKQSPRKISKAMAENRRAMNTALKCLLKEKVIECYEENVIKDGRRILDIRYTITPHQNFIEQQKMASAVKSTKYEQMNSESFLKTIAVENDSDEIF